MLSAFTPNKPRFNSSQDHLLNYSLGKEPFTNLFIPSILWLIMKEEAKQQETSDKQPEVEEKKEDEEKKEEPSTEEQK